MQNCHDLLEIQSDSRESLEEDPEPVYVASEAVCLQSLKGTL